MIPWWKVEFGEQAAAAARAAVLNRQMTMGDLTRDFETSLAAILDVPHVVATSSGTTALSLALIAAGVGCGDEVIVPNRTWISTANAPKLLGADVILVDVEADRPVISVAALAAAITPRTKAVIPVHLNGHLADMDNISALAARHGFTVIEDACQGIFSRFPDGKRAGTKSFAGCYSFAIGKPISCGQGGAVATRDAETARRLRLARTHGTSDVTMAHWEMLGGNFRFWDLPASVALTQLARFDERKKSICRLYKRYGDELARLKTVRMFPKHMHDGEVPIYAECLSEQRGALMRFFAGKGIQARPYYANINDAPQFKTQNPGPYPNSDLYAQQCFVLPSGPDRIDEEIAAVVAALNEWEKIAVKAE